ncbi:MAG: MBL fold metallo-hydrolase, partial [Spirochaetales bacterium]|nr:MBL fold metallo-hydrolase [Spirochaetales bacterium]
METFSLTLIDVGWGDSILLEFDNGSYSSFGLIDSNDTQRFSSSFIFLKKYFERKMYPYKNHKPIFEFVLLSHAHTDHGQGLEPIMREFGTKQFWYPKSIQWSGLSTLIRFANRSSNVIHHQSIDKSKILCNLGSVKLEILWPEYDKIDHNNENNNSIILLCTYNNTKFLLTGDAEAETWEKIADLLPNDINFIKVPHHGSVNGTFTNNNKTPWLDKVTTNTILGISSHIRPFEHPHQKVITQ